MEKNLKESCKKHKVYRADSKYNIKFDKTDYIILYLCVKYYMKIIVDRYNYHHCEESVILENQ